DRRAHALYAHRLITILSMSSAAQGIDLRNRLILPTLPDAHKTKTGAHEFQINFIFLLEGAPDNANARGAAIGTDNISIRVRVAQGELQGAFESNIKEPDGNVLFTATGPYTATPIHATH